MLARQLGLRPRVGLDDVVESGHALADALIEAPDDNLTVLPLRSRSRPGRELSGEPGLVARDGAAPPRLRPRPPRRRPALRRPEAPRSCTARSTPRSWSTTAP